MKIVVLFLLLSVNAFAQDSVYTRNVINALTSEYMGGRGYVNDGDKRAAYYIRSLFEEYHLQKFDSNYFQPFSFQVNTFPGSMKVRIGKSKLKPGADYIVNAASGSGKGVYKLFLIKSLTDSICSDSIKNKVAVIDKTIFTSKEDIDALKRFDASRYGFVGVIYLEKKLTFSVAHESKNIFELHILKTSFAENAETVYVNIQNQIIANHQTQNVIGYIKGTIADTFLVFTAHYDHLGCMGRKTFFPGANDNASGSSMMLNLAKHYSMPENKPKYSLVFMAFAGEEAGLIGSKFYTEHSLFPLAQIKFLVNMDLMGTGDNGMMVVNATEFEQQFQTLVKINEEQNLLPKIDKRGKAANSDHYWFTEKGVPSFFFYTLGGITAYHDIYDRPQTLPLTKYKQVFQLITEFVKTF